IPPVAVPAGSGLDGGGDEAGAVAAAGGAAGLSWANTQLPAASKTPTTSATMTFLRNVEPSDANPVMCVPSLAQPSRSDPTALAGTRAMGSKAHAAAGVDTASDVTRTYGNSRPPWACSFGGQTRRGA